MGARMSKPPSRSGGPGRGGPSRGGAGGGSRDSGRGGAPRGGPRGSAPRDGDGGSRAQRGATHRDGTRRDAPRIGSREDFREELRGGKPRRAPVRDGAPRSAEPRGGERTERRSERPAERRDGPGPRSATTRDGAPRRGPARDGARDAGRDGYRDGPFRGPRSDSRGEARAPRPNTRPGPAPRAAAPTPKDPSLPAREGDRIAKLLARAGIASRREVERLIIEGRVKLDGAVIETPSTVLTSLRGVTVDDTPVAEAEGTRLFLFHKPAGLITAERDPAGRPTIYTALRNALPPGTGRVMPIGRLDLNTEGLLLLTNDGEFKRQLELPATGVPRTYRARTFGDITQAQLEDLMEGIEVDGVIYGKIDANMERRTGRNQWIEMTLTEGKNREVRRVLEALGLQVSRLLRTAYGPFRLGDLPKGMAGEISQRDLDNFRRSLATSQGGQGGKTGA